MIPDMLPSDGCPNKPSTSRSFSLNRVFFPSSAKAAHSLPATPIASSNPEIAGETNQEAIHCSVSSLSTQYLYHASAELQIGLSSGHSVLDI